MDNQMAVAEDIKANYRIIDKCPRCKSKLFYKADFTDVDVVCEHCRRFMMTFSDHRARGVRSIHLNFYEDTKIVDGLIRRYQNEFDAW